MSDFPNNTTTMKRSLVTLFLLLLSAIAVRVLDQYLQARFISLMIVFNTIGIVMILVNWGLFKLHAQRLTENDFWLYIVIDIIVITALVLLNRYVLQADYLIPPGIDLKQYGYARIGMLLGFSYIQASIIHLGFKHVTDRIDVKQKEAQTILFTALLFGFLYTAAYTDFQLSLFIRTYVYNILLVGILSYSYNQTQSLVPGIFSLGTVYFIYMIILWLM